MNVLPHEELGQQGVLGLAELSSAVVFGLSTDIEANDFIHIPLGNSLVPECLFSSESGQLSPHPFNFNSPRFKENGILLLEFFELSSLLMLHHIQPHGFLLVALFPGFLQRSDLGVVLRPLPRVPPQCCLESSLEGLDPLSGFGLSVTGKDSVAFSRCPEALAACSFSALILVLKLFDADLQLRGVAGPALLVVVLLVLERLAKRIEAALECCLGCLQSGVTLCLLSLECCGAPEACVLDGGSEGLCLLRLLSFKGLDLFAESGFELIQGLLWKERLKLDFLPCLRLVCLEVPESGLVSLLGGFVLGRLACLGASHFSSQCCSGCSALLVVLLLEPLKFCVFICKEQPMGFQCGVPLSLKLSVTTDISKLLRLVRLAVRLQLLRTVCKLLEQLLLLILMHGSQALPLLLGALQVSLRVEDLVDSASKVSKHGLCELSGSVSVDGIIAVVVADELLDKAPELLLLGAALRPSSIQLGDEPLQRAQVITLPLVVRSLGGDDLVPAEAACVRNGGVG